MIPEDLACGGLAQPVARALAVQRAGDVLAEIRKIALPVCAVFDEENPQKFLGLVELDGNPLLSHRILADLVQPQGYAVAEETSAELALASMREKGTKFLPVVGRGGQLKGVVSQEGILAEMERRGHLAERATFTERLRTTEDQLQTMIHSAKEAVLIFGEGGALVHRNDLAADLFPFGLPALDLEVFLGALSPILPESPSSHAFLRGPSGGFVNGEYWLRRQDGSSLPVDITVMPAGESASSETFVVVRDLTEKRNAQLALEASERRFKRVANHLGEAVLFDDLAGRVVFANRAFLDLFGLSESDLPRLALEDYVAPEWHALLRDRHDRRVRGEDVPSRFEYEGLRTDGERLRLQVSVQPIIEDGRMIGTQSVIRDITAETAALRALTASEERYRALFSASPEAIAVSNQAEGIILAVNPAFSQMTGYSSEEAIGQSTVKLELWENPGIRTRITAAAVSGKIVRNQETVIRRKSGELVPTLFSLTPITLGETACFLSIWTDITERKRMEEKLTVIIKAVESASDAIGISDVQGHHFYQNRALSDLFEYATAEELEAAGGGPAVVKDPEVAKDMFEKIMSGKSWAGELEMVTKSGRVFPAYERADAIKDKGDKIVGLIGIITDITDRKRSEAKFQRIMWENDRIAELARDLLGAMSLEEINRKTLDCARELTKSPAGFAGYLTPDTGFLHVVLQGDECWEKSSLSGKAMAIEKAPGLLDWPMREKKPLWTNAPSEDERSTGLPEDHFPLRRFIAVPALDREEVLGEIGLANAPEEYGPKTVKLLERIAAQYAHALRRLQAVERLTESERRLSNLIANLPGMAYRCGKSPPWPMEFVSGGCQLLTGYSPEALIAKAPSYDEIILAEDREQVLQDVQSALAAKRPFLLHYRIRQASGSVRIVWEQGRGVWAPSGELEAIEGFIADITTEERAKRALAASEERYRAFVSSFPGIAFRYTPDKNWWDFFEGDVEVITGYPLETLAKHGKRWTCLILEEDRGICLSAIERMRVALGRFERLQFRFAHPSGRPRWLRGYALSGTDGVSDTVFIQGAFLDVTDEVESELALRESREKYSAIIEVTSDWVWEVDTDGRYTYTSQHVADLLGYAQEAVLGKTPFDFMAPEEAARVRTMFGDVLVARRAFSFVETTSLHRLGHPVILEISGVPMFDSAGIFTGYCGTARDVTQRRTAERERARLATAIRSARETIIVADADEAILYVNPAFEEVTGYKLSEVVGQHPRNLLESGKHAAEFYENISATLRERKVWRGEIWSRKKDGEHYLEEATISPILSIKDEVEGFVAVMRDVTKERALQERLSKAQEMEKLGRLVGGVAHEVRNPLNAIQACVEALQLDLGSDEEHGPMLSVIRAQVVRMTDLMRDLLQLGKPLPAQLRERVSLAEIMAKAASIWRQTHGEDAAGLTVTAKGGEALVIGVPLHLQQVVVNLLDNALQSSKPGAEIRLEMGVEEAVAVFRVWDRGRGVPSAILARVFEPFFTTRRAGTGLGLALVRHIVEQHGGQVSLENRSNGPGCVATVTLPREP